MQNLSTIATSRTVGPPSSRELGVASLRAWTMNTPIEERRRICRERHMGLAWVEIPVSLETFVYSRQYLGHPKLSPIQFETVREISEIVDIDAARHDPSQVVIREDQKVEIVCVWGKGSGKNTVVIIAMARMMYLLGCMYSPQLTLNMPEYSSIDMLNVALNKDQAAENFFDPLKRLINRSWWFTKKLQVRIMDSRISAPPIIGRDERVGDMYAVNAWSGHSSVDALEGKNLIIGVLDELDAFKYNPTFAGNKAMQSTATADTMYEMVLTSVRSRFPKVGKTVSISWPRRKQGKIMELLVSGRADPTTFTSGPYAVWDVHPQRAREDFDRDFMRNPELARAKYAAMPGESTESYYTNPVAVLSTFHAEREEGALMFRFVRSQDDPGPEPPVGDDGVLRYEYLAKPDPRAVYCWHGDLALRNDRAALAMAHHSGWINDELSGDRLPVVTLDLLVWWKAPEYGEIQLVDVRRLILDMSRAGYKTGSVTFDSFASAEMIQHLKRYDRLGRPLRFDRNGNPLTEPMNATGFSVDTSLVGHDTLKSMIYESRLVAFYNELLIDELLSLELTPNARKVDHPSSGSKDCADAVAGAVYGALQHLSPVVIEYSKPGVSMIGVNRREQYGNDLDILNSEERRRPRAFG